MSCAYVMVNTYMSSAFVMCICHSDMSWRSNCMYHGVICHVDMSSRMSICHGG